MSWGLSVDLTKWADPGDLSLNFPEVCRNKASILFCQCTRVAFGRESRFGESVQAYVVSFC